MMKRALILGGGGAMGIAWETGMLVGLADKGVDLRNADLIVGTSAGSNTAIALTGGLSYEEMFQVQVDPALKERELPVQRDFTELMAELMAVGVGTASPLEERQRTGAYALAAQTASEEERRLAITDRLRLNKAQDWPSSRVKIVVVDALSGERVVLDRESGVDLVSAVAASGALPGVWPAITINGRKYVDGGVYSLENADLAAGFDKVLVLQPIPTLSRWNRMETQLEELRQSNPQIEVQVITLEDGVKKAIAAVSSNLMDPAVREVSARKGREQGQAIAERVAALWG